MPGRWRRSASTPTWAWCCSEGPGRGAARMHRPPILAACDPPQGSAKTSSQLRCSGVLVVVGDQGDDGAAADPGGRDAFVIVDRQRRLDAQQLPLLPRARCPPGRRRAPRAGRRTSRPLKPPSREKPRSSTSAAAIAAAAWRPRGPCLPRGGRRAASRRPGRPSQAWRRPGACRQGEAFRDQQPAPIRQHRQRLQPAIARGLGEAGRDIDVAARAHPGSGDSARMRCQRSKATSQVPSGRRASASASRGMAARQGLAVPSRSGPDCTASSPATAARPAARAAPVIQRPRSLTAREAQVGREMQAREPAEPDRGGVEQQGAERRRGACPPGRRGAWPGEGRPPVRRGAAGRQERDRQRRKAAQQGAAPATGRGRLRRARQAAMRGAREP